MATVTYFNQPGIHRTRGSVPLAGNSHVYTANNILWPHEVEEWLKTQLVGQTLHVCCGKSQLGDVRVDLYETSADFRYDAAALPFDDKSFDTYLADIPYNGRFGWMHQTLNEAIRIARKRIIWQSWFIPANKDGLLKKAHAYELTGVAVVPSIRGHEHEVVPAIYDPETKSYWVAQEDQDDPNKFELVGKYLWQSTAYFGRAQIISVFDRMEK